MEITLKFVVVCLCLLLAFVSGKPNEVDERKNIVSEKCLKCICVASTGCDLNAPCGVFCGPYFISLPYWIDAGRPKVNEEDGDAEEAMTKDDKDFKNCAKDLECASRAVEGYVKRYATDCDGDGKINCDDYARIHRRGPLGCSQPLDAEYEKAYKKCIKDNAYDF